MAVPSHTDVQFKIRIPADLKERVDASAKANSRSTTAEIVAVLEEKYPAPKSDLKFVHLWMARLREREGQLNEVLAEIARIVDAYASATTPKALVESRKQLEELQRAHRRIAEDQERARDFFEASSLDENAPTPTDD